MVKYTDREDTPGGGVVDFSGTPPGYATPAGWGSLTGYTAPTGCTYCWAADTAATARRGIILLWIAYFNKPIVDLMPSFSFRSWRIFSMERTLKNNSPAISLLLFSSHNNSRIFFSRSLRGISMDSVSVFMFTCLFQYIASVN